MKAAVLTIFWLMLGVAVLGCGGLLYLLMDRDGAALQEPAIAYPVADESRQSELWDFIADTGAVAEVGYTAAPYMLIRPAWYTLPLELKEATAIAALEYLQRKYRLEASDDLLLIKRQPADQSLPEVIGSFTRSMGLRTRH